MRVSYTTLAVGALIFLAGCGTSSPEIVAPGNGSANIATDTTTTANTAAERGGAGLMGSGN